MSQSKGAGAGGKPEIIEYRFRIYATSLILNNSLPAGVEYAIYLEKGKQVLGEVKNRVNSSNSRKKIVQFAAIKNPIDFQIFNERNMHCQWAVYICKDEKQQFYESIPFDLKQSWSIFSGDKKKSCIALQQKFQRIDAIIKFCLIIALDVQTLNRVANTQLTNEEKKGDQTQGELQQSLPQPKQNQIENSPSANIEEIVIQSKAQESEDILIKQAERPSIQINENTVQQKHSSNIQQLVAQDTILERNTNIETNLNEREQIGQETEQKISIQANATSQQQQQPLIYQQPLQIYTQSAEKVQPENEFSIGHNLEENTGYQQQWSQQQVRDVRVEWEEIQQDRGQETTEVPIQQQTHTTKQPSRKDQQQDRPNLDNPSQEEQEQRVESLPKDGYTSNMTKQRIDQRVNQVIDQVHDKDAFQRVALESSQQPEVVQRVTIQSKYQPAEVPSAPRTTPNKRKISILLLVILLMSSIAIFILASETNLFGGKTKKNKTKKAKKL